MFSIVNRPTRLISFVLASLVSSVAPASIMLTLESITPFGPDYDWNYSATITPDDGLLGGGSTFFTIYDLPGNIITVESATDWNAGSSAIGETPSGLTPTDDATKANVTFTAADSVNYPGSNTPYIFPFKIRLDTNIAELNEYAWQDFDSYPNPGAVLQSGLGTVGDGIGIDNDGVVPAPATLALLGLGLLCLRLRRRA